jgi:hypothetical protein
LGDENIVSDLLSHDFHLSNNQLNSLIKPSVPSQLPFGIKISLHPHRDHFLSDWSAAQTAMKGAAVIGTNAKQTCAWNHCQNYITSIGSTDDPFLEASPKLNGIEFSAPLLKLSKKVDFVLENLADSG